MGAGFERDKHGAGRRGVAGRVERNDLRVPSTWRFGRAFEDATIWGDDDAADTGVGRRSAPHRASEFGGARQTRRVAQFWLTLLLEPNCGTRANVTPLPIAPP